MSRETAAPLNGVVIRSAGKNEQQPGHLIKRSLSLEKFTPVIQDG
jgi:hypothetical protein